MRINVYPPFLLRIGCLAELFLILNSQQPGYVLPVASVLVPPVIFFVVFLHLFSFE